MVKVAPERAALISRVYFASLRLNAPGGWEWVERPYLIEPLMDESRYRVIRKATQVGASTLSMIHAIHGCQYRYPLGAIYYLPTDGEMRDFVKGKVDPLLDGSGIVLGDQGEVENVRIKAIGLSRWYLRGLRSKAGTRVISGDLLILDELDDMEPRERKMAEDRISDSKIKEVIELSRPSLPGVGIDASFQATDQRHWIVPCRACRKEVCLEESWPACVGEVGGRWTRICPGCGAELTLYDGGWVPKCPDQAVPGWQMSQLIKPSLDVGELVKDWKETRYKDIFHNSRLGLPYIDADRQLDREAVLRLCGGEPVFPVRDGRPITNATMGVDQGRDLHAVVSWDQMAPEPSGEWKRTGKRQYWLGVFRDWEELDGVIKRFRVWRCVVDALPDQRGSEALRSRHPGVVLLNYYEDSVKGDPVFDEKLGIVKSHRTRSLDWSAEEIERGTASLPPRGELALEFADHCQRSVKVLKEDKDGNRWYEWAKTGPDHFRHAQNYDAIARSGPQPRVTWL